MTKNVIPAFFSLLLVLSSCHGYSQSTPYYSITSGYWETPGTWSTVSHSGPPASTAPGSGCRVYIGDGNSFLHTIIVSSNNATCDTLSLAAGSVLDQGNTTGHHFGVVTSGSLGTLRISSGTATAQFPAGDFSLFLGSGGGTVEYYSTTRSFTMPIVTSAPTSVPITSYNSLICSVATGKTISMGDSDLEIWHDMTVESADATTAVELNNASESSLTIHGNLWINSGKLLFMNWNNDALTLTVDSSVMVASGATFTVDKNGPGADNTLIIGGSLINNGTFDMSSEQAFRAYPVVFTGLENATISGNGPVTDFFALHVNKGNSASSILEVTSSAFSFSNNTNPLILYNGTFRLTSAVQVTIAADTFAIPSTTRLSANGGTLLIAPAGDNSDDVLLAGTLEVISGTICIGDSSRAIHNDIVYTPTGSPAIGISGGTLFVNGQIRRNTSMGSGSLSYTQSGNTLVKVFGQNGQSGFGQLEVANTGSVFNMSDGTLWLVRGLSTTVSDLLLTPSSSTVTGGTIVFGSPATETAGQANAFTLESAASLYNLTVNGTTTPKTVTLQTYALTMGGNLLIEPTSSFVANGLDLTIAGNLTNQNGSSAAGSANGGFQPGSVSQTTTCNGSMANQTITGVGGNLTNFGNLVIANSGSEGIVSLQSNTAIRILQDLTITGTSTFVACANDTVTVCGDWTNNGAFEHNGGTVRFSGTTQQITGDSANLFNNLTLESTSTTTMITAGQRLLSILFCDGTLEANGNLTLLSSATQTALIDGEGLGEVTGRITMQRYLPSGFGYKYFSSPFQDATVGEFADEMDLSATFPTFYSYNEADTASGWEIYTEASQPLLLLNGYAVNFGPSPDAITVDMAGTVNNGSLDARTVYNHNTTFTLGFNLLGNPYPSPIDWDATEGWTRNEIDDALYFFNAGSVNQYLGTYSSYVNGISSDGTASNIIPSMQGFFIHVADGSYPVTGSVQTDNRIRTNDLAPAFHKSTTSIGHSYIRLSASLGAHPNSKDPLVIRFTGQDATPEFDPHLDALKRMNTDLTFPNFFLLTPLSVRLSIQSVPPMITGESCRFPLGIQTSTAGTVRIELSDYSSDIYTYYIYLHDAYNGIYHRLQGNEAYAPFLEEGSHEDRFSLVISETDIRFRPDEDIPLYAYAIANRLYVTVNIGSSQQGKLILHNLMGQKIREITVVESGQYEYILSVSTAMYVVSLVTESVLESRKIIIVSH